MKYTSIMCITVFIRYLLCEHERTTVRYKTRNKITVPSKKKKKVYKKQIQIHIGTPILYKFSLQSVLVNCTHWSKQIVFNRHGVRTVVSLDFNWVPG